MSTQSATDPPPLTLAVAELWPPQGQWTEADYFRLPETSRQVELSGGEVTIMAPPGFTHQRVLDNLYSRLKEFVRENELGVTAFAPLAVRLWPGKIREPDIVYYAAGHLDRIGEQVSGPPDLAVEVVSPGTRRTDRHDKFSEYAQAGINEYWIVEPGSETVEVYVLDEGVYSLFVKAGPDAASRALSRLLPGFEVAVAVIFAG